MLQEALGLDLDRNASNNDCMVSALQLRSLYQSDILVVEDVVCRACKSTFGGEEQSLSNDIVFPRSGLFVKRDRLERSVANPNHALFFRKGETFEISHPVDGGDSCTVFTFADEVLREGIAGIGKGVDSGNDTLFPKSHCSADSGVWLLHLRLSTRMAAGDMPCMAADEMAMDLLAATAKNLQERIGRRHRRSRPTTLRAHRDLAHALQLVLAQHYDDPPNLTKLARMVHSSPYHLSRLFRRIVGVPIHRYLNSLRLRDSLEKLAEGESDLTRLALDLGYSSHSHFSTAFRREFALTPAQFRASANTALLLKMSKNLKVSQ